MKQIFRPCDLILKLYLLEDLIIRDEGPYNFKTVSWCAPDETGCPDKVLNLHLLDHETYFGEVNLYSNDFIVVEKPWVSIHHPFEIGYEEVKHTYFCSEGNTSDLEPAPNKVKGGTINSSYSAKIDRILQDRSYAEPRPEPQMKPVQQSQGAVPLIDIFISGAYEQEKSALVCALTRAYSEACVLSRGTTKHQRRGTFVDKLRFYVLSEPALSFEKNHIRHFSGWDRVETETRSTHFKFPDMERTIVKSSFWEDAGVVKPQITETTRIMRPIMEEIVRQVEDGKDPNDETDGIFKLDGILSAMKITVNHAEGLNKALVSEVESANVSFPKQDG